MKRYVVITVCMLVGGCVTQQDQTEAAKTLASSLEASKDVITAIETYNEFVAHCFRNEINDTRNGNSRVPFDYGLYSGGCNKAVLRELSQPEVDLGCLYKNWGTTEKYDSDECIIQRREHPADRSGFFDYSRFLPKNSRIKNNADWLHLVDFYNETYCYSTTEELTTEEIQQCRAEHKQTVIKLATTQSALRCSNTYSKLYKQQVMKGFIGWCGCVCSKDFLVSQLQRWAEAHFCDKEGWETDADFRSVKFFDCLINSHY